MSAPVTVPVTGHDQYLRTRHFGSLDGLRFLCIAAVIWHHTPLWLNNPQWPILAVRGHVGVDFFFVLSGFLITTLLLRERKDRGQINLRGFYWRRLLRIVPIYYLVVAVSMVWAIGLKGDTSAWDKLPYYLLFLSNFLIEHVGFLDPTWSLSMEEQYYLIWPLLLIFLPPRWLVPVLGVLIAVNLAGVMGAFRPLGIEPFVIGQLLFQLGGATYAPILMGSLAAVMLHHRTSFDILARILSFKVASAVCLFAVVAVLGLVTGELEGWPNLALHGAMTLTVVALVLREDNALAPVLQLRPIARIGQISYGIYLYHLFALAIVARGLEAFGIMNAWLVLILYFALSILMAEISFRTFEAWFMGFRKRGWGRVQTA